MAHEIKKAQEIKNVSKVLNENIAYMNEALGVEKSFDVIYRKWIYGQKEMALYFVDGFVKDDVLNVLTVNLAKLDRGDVVPDTLEKLMYTYIGYVEVDRTRDLEKLVNTVLAGPLILFIDGADEALIIDARTYPARGPEEPDLEKVVRGPKDGFTETIIFNTALTRRRVRDRSLRMEYFQIGKRSQTDVIVSYIEDIADPKLVNEIKQRLEKIEVDGLPMAEKTLEEFLFKKNWNPFPMVRYTERPDVAASHLLDGHVLIYTDTSPSVMITPTTLFHHFQHAEEFRQKPVVGVYLRWVRFLAMFASVFVLPLWFYVATHPEVLPEALDFLGIKDKAKIPLIWQFIIAELGIDALRMASIHVPSPLATALGLVSAIVLGQVAVEAGLFVNEVILYLSIAVVGNFATPSYELSMANRMVRLSLLILTAIFSWYGLVGGTLLWFLLLLFSRSITLSYLWPLLPFNWRGLRDILIRPVVPNNKKRPSVMAPNEPDKK